MDFEKAQDVMNLARKRGEWPVYGSALAWLVANAMRGRSQTYGEMDDEERASFLIARATRVAVHGFLHE